MADTPDIEDLTEFKLAAELEDTKSALARTMRKLERSKAKKADLVEAVRISVLDAAKSLQFDPIKPPEKDRRRKGEEYAVAVLSDWQLAKVTPDYSTPVCEERVDLYGDKLIELVNIQRADHPVKKLRVYLLGDIVEGELIFPGQSHLIDASLYSQVMVDGPRILANFLRKMLPEFEEIHVIGVIGNHGRLGGRSSRDYNPESNADRMLYRFVAELFANEPRITFEIPDGANERNWWAADDLGAFRPLLFHGDQIRGGFAGFPWYGFGKKVQGWANGAIPVEFTDALCGHWHQPVVFPLNFITVRVNGSTESTNTYAQEQLAAAGRPCQWLLFVHPEVGITAEYRVWLDQ